MTNNTFELPSDADAVLIDIEVGNPNKWGVLIICKYTDDKQDFIYHHSHNIKNKEQLKEAQKLQLEFFDKLFNMVLEKPDKFF